MNGFILFALLSSKTEKSVCYFNESMTTWCMMLLLYFVLYSSLLLLRRQFEMGTVNNDVRSDTPLDVDISMIHLHQCNGIIHLNKREKNYCSTLCCYEREKHFPNMAD